MNALDIALHDLFTQILAELRLMQLVLEQEALGLKDCNAEAVEKIAQEKQARAHKLDTLAECQEHLLRTLNLPAGKEGVECLLSNLLQTDPTTRNLTTIWQDLQNTTVQCRKLNEANGAYIGLLRQHVQRSLDIVHGQPSQDFVYGPDGVGRRPMPSRKLLSV